MKKLINLSLLLFTIQILLTGLFAQDQQKAELIFQGNINSFQNEFNSPFEFSSDGKQFATVWKNKIVLWDIETGRVLRIFGIKENKFGYFTSIAISSDGKYLAGGFFDKKQIVGRVIFWNVSDGKEISEHSELGFLAMVLDLDFSPDQRLLISTSIGISLYDMPSKTNNSIIVWKNGPGVTTGWDYSVNASFSPDGKHIFWRTSYQARAGGGFLIGREPFGNEIPEFIIDRNLSINNKGEFVFINEKKKTANIEKFVYNEKLDDGDYQTIQTIDKDFQSAFFNPQIDDELIISSIGKILKRNLKSKKDVEIQLEKNSKAVTAISDNGKFVTDGLTIWDANTGKLIQDFSAVVNISTVLDYSDKSVYVNSDDKIYIGMNGKNALVWDLKSGGKPFVEKFNEQNNQFSINNDPIQVNDFKIVFYDSFVNIESEKASSNTGIFVFSNLLLKHFDAENNILTVISSEPFDVGIDIFKLKKYAYEKDFYEFERIGGIVISLDVGYRGHVPPPIRLDELQFDKTTLLAEAGKLKDKSPKFVRDLQTYFNEPLTKNDKYRVAAINNSIKIFDNESGIEICSLYATSSEEWAVITPNGLFDASSKAKKFMHYVLGLEPISLDQMKDLYYVPGLLQKIFKGEPLPKVELFSKKDLFPTVEFSQPKEGQKDLSVKLTNRGGGIGQVQILVNGKEFVGDARAIGFDANAKEATLTVSLKDAPFILGKENRIEVIAKNAAGSLTNRGTARGTAVFNLGGVESREKPNIYVIVGGISNYTNDNLKLGFAAKDAEDFAKAIEIGAVKLLGDKSKVHIRLLTSNGTNSTAKFDIPDSKILTATKADFEKAFADFKDATPNDVFIVYLAGHGVALNLNQNPSQAGGDTYLYLTQEATTTDKSILTIENSRKAMTISSEELKDLMKTNKALKQVLILDTCAAGALSNSLVAKRDLPSDQIKAMETLKDNTGFFVLMGSSADAVSYEASQYGQGLLTYSLLQAMKGARLRDGSFAFVNELFDYAQATVPDMAKNIGGIQRPVVITPDLSGTFPIGQFTIAEQKQITLSNPKPLILRPNLQNEKLRFDNLKLTVLLRDELRNVSFVNIRGNPSPIVFVEADEMTDAITPSGNYTVDGDNLQITVVLVRNNAQIGKEIIVSGKLSDKEGLIKEIVAKLTEAAKAL